MHRYSPYVLTDQSSSLHQLRKMENNKTFPLQFQLHQFLHSHILSLTAICECGAKTDQSSL